jgi:hypothetical protein
MELAAVEHIDGGLDATHRINFCGQRFQKTSKVAIFVCLWLND